MSNLENALIGFINEKQGEVDSQEPSFVIDAFRQQFDNMQSIVKLFRKNRHKNGFEKGAYKTIAEILFEQDVKKKNDSELSIAQVCRYLNIIRAEKKAEDKNKVVPRKVVETRFAPSIAPVLKPRRVVIAAVPVDDWLPEKVRLQGEPDDATWSGEDQWMWNQLLESAKSVNRDVFKNIIDVEDRLDGTQKQVYKLLRSKYKALFMQPA